MAATLHRIDSPLFDELKSGDERAFERLFREWYAAAVEEALPLLDGDGEAAARDVEGVFQRVWKGHEDFTTPDELAAYLHRAVHDGAVRIRSHQEMAQQLAGHEKRGKRKDGKRRAPTADEAWSKVHGAMHAGAMHTTPAPRTRARSHPEMSAAIGAMAGPRRSVWKVAAGIALAGVVVTALWMGSRPREADVLAAGLTAPGARTVATRLAQFGSVSLLDGSTARLGPESKLLIPPSFGESVRGLRLDGTATFTVAPAQKLNFTVIAGNATLVALGTEFTVRAYPEERDVVVRVTEGTVTATVGNRVRELVAGDALVITSDSVMRSPSAAELEESLGWADGIVVAADRPLREALDVARRWFGLEFVIADAALLDRTVTIRAGVGAVDSARRSIETSGRLQRVWVDSMMVLRSRSSAYTGR